MPEKKKTTEIKKKQGEDRVSVIFRKEYRGEVNWVPLQYKLHATFNH